MQILSCDFRSTFKRCALLLVVALPFSWTTSLLDTLKFFEAIRTMLIIFNQSIEKFFSFFLSVGMGGVRTTEVNVSVPAAQQPMAGVQQVPMYPTQGQPLIQPTQPQPGYPAQPQPGYPAQPQPGYPAAPNPGYPGKSFLL